MTRVGEPGDPYYHNLLKRYDNWSLFVHDSQTYPGRAYAALHREGSIDPFLDTTHEEQEELTVVVQELTVCLNGLYRPDLYNYANLRNEWSHCHWHVIPRYETPRHIHGEEFVDENWGHNYAPYPGREIGAQVFAAIKADMRAALLAA